MIGLEKTFYNVSSGENELVEFCAVVVDPNILCPIEFPFNVSFEFKGIYSCETS